MARITIDDRLCKRCGICVEFCPSKALQPPEVEGEPPKTVDERCLKCRLCELLCPDFAIAIED
ncbi:MAG: 2-ketoglutarate ferredoxin oxidoreductase subunit delta [Thermoprotei archaeon]|nr:MAG: 2-ketoglutarate ferredoxin oxidoreductase subunit delta [Thermoprotei archaeon]